jgi:hypothetical protein
LTELVYQVIHNPFDNLFVKTANSNMNYKIFQKDKTGSLKASFYSDLSSVSLIPIKLAQININTTEIGPFYIKIRDN